MEVAARTRTIPPAVRRALHYRDRGCRFPGCGVRFGQGHHIRHWAQGGPTTLSNLALLCRRHHRAVHEEGYQIDRHPGGELQFRRPDGRLLPVIPPPPEVPDDSVSDLRARHDAQGLRPHARTAMSSWLGEHLDVALRDRRLASLGDELKATAEKALGALRRRALSWLYGDLRRAPLAFTCRPSGSPPGLP